MHSKQCKIDFIHIVFKNLKCSKKGITKRPDFTEVLARFKCNLLLNECDNALWFVGELSFRRQYEFTSLKHKIHWHANNLELLTWPCFNLFFRSRLNKCITSFIFKRTSTLNGTQQKISSHMTEESNNLRSDQIGN